MSMTSTISMTMITKMPEVSSNPVENDFIKDLIEKHAVMEVNVLGTFANQDKGYTNVLVDIHLPDFNDVAKDYFTKWIKEYLREGLTSVRYCLVMLLASLDAKGNVTEMTSYGLTPKSIISKNSNAITVVFYGEKGNNDSVNETVWDYMAVAFKERLRSNILASTLNGNGNKLDSTEEVFTTRKLVIKTLGLNPVYVYKNETEKEATLTITNEPPNQSPSNLRSSYVMAMEDKTSLTMVLRPEFAFEVVKDAIDILEIAQGLLAHHILYNTGDRQIKLEEVNAMIQLPHIQTKVETSMNKLKELLKLYGV